MKTTNLKKAAITTFSAASIFFMLFFYGCSEDSVTGTNGTNGNGNGNGTNGLSVSVMNNDLTDHSGDNIIIDDAKALINEVELETEPSGTEQEVHLAPFVIHFNINGGISSFTAASLPAGTYNKIKFKLHKPEDNETPPDPEFKEGNSGNQRYSFIIKGRINGVSFVYKSSKSASLVINLNKSINLQNSGINITMLFNKLSWFQNGNIVLDPRDHGNDDLIDDHIKNSFSRAFRDDDKNGQEDH